MFKKPCIVCGKPFLAQRDTAKYCGDACRTRVYRQRAKAALQPRNCRHCGKPFQPKTNKAHFCSRRCSNIARSAAIKSDEAGQAARNALLRRVLTARRLGEGFDL